MIEYERKRTSWASSHVFIDQDSFPAECSTEIVQDARDDATDHLGGQRVAPCLTKGSVEREGTVKQMTALS
jgi:hypothetical protein